MKRIMKEQVLMLHTIAINQTAGLDGVRDEAMLDSALNSPFQTFDGEALYKTIHTKASRLAFAIINNHPFIDGNKRIGLLTMLVFLKINDVLVECTDEELIDLGLGIASGKYDSKYILDWIMLHTDMM